jgi:hypothetical protein
MVIVNLNGGWRQALPTAWMSEGEGQAGSNNTQNLF